MYQTFSIIKDRDIKIPAPKRNTFNELRIFQEILKWQKQQDEYNRKRKEHQMHLVEIERKEVERREEELRQRKELLKEKQRKHAKIENDIIEQVRVGCYIRLLPLITTTRKIILIK